jgi:hypothetical protein
LWVFLAGSSSKSGGLDILLDLVGALIASYCLLFLGIGLFSFFASCEATPNVFATRYPDEGVSPIPGIELSAGLFAPLHSSASRAKRSAAELCN